MIGTLNNWISKRLSYYETNGYLFYKIFKVDNLITYNYILFAITFVILFVAVKNSCRDYKEYITCATNVVYAGTCVRWYDFIPVHTFVTSSFGVILWNVDDFCTH